MGCASNGCRTEVHVPGCQAEEAGERELGCG